MRLINAPNGFLESAAFLVCFVIQHLHHGDPQTCFEKPVPCISRDASGRHRSVSGLIVVQRRLRQSVLAGCLSRTVLHTLLSPTPCRVLSSLGTSPDRDSIYEQLDAASGVCPYWGTASSSASGGRAVYEEPIIGLLDDLRRIDRWRCRCARSCCPRMRILLVQGVQNRASDDQPAPSSASHGA